VKLFVITYKEEEAETKRLCTKPHVTQKYGNCNWRTLEPAMKQVLVDLKFMGDYSAKIRDILQSHVVANNIKGFPEELSDQSKWAAARQRIPNGRFQR